MPQVVLRKPTLADIEAALATDPIDFHTLARALAEHIAVVGGEHALAVLDAKADGGALQHEIIRMLDEAVEEIERGNLERHTRDQRGN